MGGGEGKVSTNVNGEKVSVSGRVGEVFEVVGEEDLEEGDGGAHGARHGRPAERDLFR